MITTWWSDTRISLHGTKERREWYQRGDAGCPSVQPRVPRDHDDASRGYGEATLVLGFVLADHEARGDPHTLVDDRLRDAGVPSDVDAVHQHAVGHLGVRVDADLRSQDAA